MSEYYEKGGHPAIEPKYFNSYRNFNEIYS